MFIYISYYIIRNEYYRIIINKTLKVKIYINLIRLNFLKK